MSFIFPGLKNAGQLEAAGYCSLLMSPTTLEKLVLTSSKLLPAPTKKLGAAFKT